MKRILLILTALFLLVAVIVVGLGLRVLLLVTDNLRRAFRWIARKRW